jgi:Uncharacterized membrane-associated protein
MLHDFINWILATVEAWGYWGIFIAMAMESTVLPVPSELVVIPAGMLAYQGKMSLFGVIMASTFGSLLGATINYVFAMWVGRPFLEKYGKYFFVRPALLHKTRCFLHQTRSDFDLYRAFDSGDSSPDFAARRISGDEFCLICVLHHRRRWLVVYRAGTVWLLHRR